VKYGYKNCTRHIKLSIDYIDSQLARPWTSAKIKQQFLGRTAEKGSNAGFADVLMYPFYGWQSSGVDTSIKSLCEHLDSGSTKKQASNTAMEGKRYSDLWASWPGFIRLVNSYNSFGHCEGPNPDGNFREPNCLLDERFDGTLSISWTWQHCTEWGYFQSTNTGPHALGSRYNTQTHQQELCYRQFPDGLKSGYLPKEPQTGYINRITGGWNMRPSNVFFTEGEFDPWRTLSMFSDEPWAPKWSISEKIPTYDASVGTKNLFGKLLKSSEHCYDFRPEKAETQDLFAEALRKWLKCFPRRR
jgi:hypothetical protein